MVRAPTRHASAHPDRWQRPAILVTTLLVASMVAGPSGASAQDAEGDGPRHGLLVEEGPAAEALVHGANQAADDLSVQLHVEMVSPSVSLQRGALERLLDEGLRGLILAVSEPADMARAIDQPFEGPLVLTGHGLDDRDTLGAAAFVGPDENEAGAAAAMALVEHGASRLLCVQVRAGDPVLEARCDGAREAVAATAELDLLYALDPPGDPTGVRDAIEARLLTDQGIDALLATESAAFKAAHEALARAGLEREILVMTFAAAPAEGRRSGSDDMGAGCAVLSRPALEGYLAMATLVHALDGSPTALEAPAITIAPSIETSGCSGLGRVLQ